MVWFGLVFLLAVLYLGSIYGGVGLGAISGIGIFIEVFIFRLPPSSPPITVMLIILAVVTCASVLEAAGGLNYMLRIAERILRNNPRQITLLGPTVTYMLTFLTGTGHAVYSILPVIGDVALKHNIRPERPMAVSSVASQLAIVASPISAAVVYYLATLSSVDKGITLAGILVVTIPASFIGMVAAALWSTRRGLELEKDPEYQSRLNDPVQREKILATVTTLDEKLPKSAKLSVYLFIAGIASIVAAAMFPGIRPLGTDREPLTMAVMIQIMMLTTAGIMLILTKTPASQITKGAVFQNGMVAVIAIFGIAWMSDTYFAWALPSFKDSLTNMIKVYPWSFALAMFIVSVMINSQAATCTMMLPLALGLGVPPAVLIGIMPSCYGHFFIPNYPSDIAAINFDRSGTTKIGKYYFNHSFMIPGLIAVFIACVTGCLIAGIML